MSHLHVFDMDGTLIHGTSAATQIARTCGTEAELLDLERRFSAGEIDTRAFSATLHALWSELTEEHVERAFAAAPFLAEIREVCADIRARGEHSLVITMSTDFFARRLLDFGFDEVVASRFPALPFREPLDPADVLTPQDKVRVTEEARTRAGIPLERCVAYGDSLSDAPLFGHVPHSVAVNADHHVARLARARYRGTSLMGAYVRGRALLAGGAVPEADAVAGAGGGPAVD
ncbi:HAD family hydrolase [Streptomonospora nanhaiensis]|uniref:Phosphoserine phosphatase n=1 Tax=Streptomonospora nanhaiensis TaxID=1323731 RepID=A0A853BP84_9ACTN|nr:HAD-IB family phosphatase [Streptomonospora nanhaiensis]MBV2364915.1 HAD-IB family phosphatase [Streptomonospora nanhaiensis]MBX9391112.1 HAD-IB family phosphatase [Streptomonospora nanhaiensis]NYI97258.1 phosphoserine phosphatase [Streptomonospora nanhaiensis]